MTAAAIRSGPTAGAGPTAGVGPTSSDPTASAGPVVLVAHGSRDPRAAASTRALVRAVAAARPGVDVRAAYLDHAGPRPGAVLADLQAAGYPQATVVPLLLTEAFHGRVDIPEVVRAAQHDGLRIPVTTTQVLGPPVGCDTVEPLLTGGLLRRLAEVATDCDAVVLAAAGTRSAPARATVELVAEALGRELAVPCAVGYASAAPPTAGAAVESLTAAGARRVAVAGYFLAPGLLYDTASTSALRAGAVAVAAPLGGLPEVARLVLQLIDRATVPVAV